MTEEALTHDRCSELLRDFAEGRLDTADGARVEAHLETCAECSAELRAVMALRVADDPLSDLERARLHKAIDAGVGDVIVARPQTPRWGPRLAAALGTAALLAIVGVAVVSFGTGGGDDEGDAGGAAQVAEDSEQGGGGQDDTNTAAGGADLAEAAAPLPRPSFDDDAGVLSDRKFRRIVGKNSALKSFSSAYSADDATRLRDEYVSELATQAGPQADRIRNCAERVYEENRYFALPAYAARGRLEGREALVLGFAWTDERAGPLNQFMLWTWPQSSCDVPIDYRAGNISPRK